jgi:hypothetical protein
MLTQIFDSPLHSLQLSRNNNLYSSSLYLILYHVSNYYSFLRAQTCCLIQLYSHSIISILYNKFRLLYRSWSRSCQSFMILYPLSIYDYATPLLPDYDLSFMLILSFVLFNNFSVLYTDLYHTSILLPAHNICNIF